MANSVQHVLDTYDEQIATCEARIAQYTGKIAALAGNPDGGTAREVMAKVLESERNLRVSLEEQRAELAKKAHSRRFQRVVTWRWVVFVALAFAASLFYAHTRHH